MDPAPFLRGVAFPGSAKVAYPRARLEDVSRMPIDTWAQAQIPVGVRLEMAGDTEAVEIDYRTATEDLGYRGDGAGRTFQLWRGGELVDEDKALLGEGTARLSLGGAAPDERSVVYLPEGMKPAILDVRSEGWIEPAPPQPRWVCYGDSIAEGWIASAPALGWAHIVGREQGLDVVNLGYASAARGEIVSAEHVAALPADVIAITHGTNCWTRIPHSIAQMRANLSAFLDVVRQGHPEIPVVVVSPVVRPDAEDTANSLGATLSQLRAAIESVVNERIDGGESHLHLVPGLPLITAALLGDDVHPSDEGHRVIAHALGPVLKEMVA